MHYWARGSLPDDDRQLAAIGCMTEREWRKAKPIIQALFKDGWKHKRVEQEILEAQAKYERREKASESGNEKRWKTKRTPNRIPMRSQTESQMRS